MKNREKLIQLKKELFDSSKRNPFVNVKPHALWFEGVADNVVAEKVYRNAKFLRKEYGLDTTLQIHLFLNWPINNSAKELEFVCSPLLFKPARIVKTKRIDTSYSVEVSEGPLVLNPVVRYLFQQAFNINLAESFETVDDFIINFKAEFETNNNIIPVVFDFEVSQDWLFVRRLAVGNFNYKKSTLAKDYEQIIAQPSESILALLNGDSSTFESPLIQNSNAVHLDDSQLKIVNRGLNENLIVQGPPGTGKSHTITALITACLLENKKVLFVSEKKSALDVVNERLVHLGLQDSIAYFNTQKDQKRNFYAALKQIWSNLVQEPFVSKNQISKANTDDLFSCYPTQLFEKNEKHQTNIHTCIDKLVLLGFSPNELVAVGPVPDFNEWEQAEDFLARFETDYLPYFNADCFAKASFIHLNSSIFTEENFSHKLDKNLNEALRILLQIEKIQLDYRLPSDYKSLIKLAISASILAMVDKDQMELLRENSEVYKQFDLLSKKYESTNLKLNQAIASNAKWSNKPSLSEVTELMDLLNSELKLSTRKKSIFRMLRHNSNRLKMAFIDFDSAISVHTKIKLLDGIKLELRLQSQLDAIKLKLKHNLKIANPENEIPLIRNLRNKLNAVSHNDYVMLLEHDESNVLIPKLANLHPAILQFNSIARFLFKIDEQNDLKDIRKKMTDILRVIPVFNQFQYDFSKFFQLSNSVLRFLRVNYGDVKKLSGLVSYAALLEMTRFEPWFKQLSGSGVEENYEEKRLNTQREFKFNLQQINARRINNFKSKELLLLKPSYKLSKAEKSLKKELKDEKRILIHEINKKQQHLPLIRLIESCTIHLMDIVSVWMMNPLAVSENLPCQANLFDLVIFDEASQIPLEDAIPAVFRAKKVVIVGDEMQMPPSSFFSSKTAVKTVLDQGQFAFPVEMLKWHYRSKHPALITFSNDHFYQQNLVTLPPASKDNPLIFKKVNGVFENRRNKIEAFEIAKLTHNLLDQGEKDIGVIAFSKEQENEIRLQFKEQKVPLDSRVLIRNLENVQGIEKEVIILSIAYAPNEVGDFRLNFGPINKVNGANRLNVLFSRAIRQMFVFSSITYHDIELSENKGVEILCSFLRFIANYESEKEDGVIASSSAKIVAEFLNDKKKPFTYYLHPDKGGLESFISFSKEAIVLINPGQFAHDPKNLFAYINALKNKFKVVKIILNLDLWLNRSKVEKMLMDYF